MLVRDLRSALGATLLLGLAACSPGAASGGEPAAIHLASIDLDGRVDGTAASEPMPEPIVWRFDDLPDPAAANPEAPPAGASKDAAPENDAPPAGDGNDGHDEGDTDDGNDTDDGGDTDDEDGEESDDDLDLTATNGFDPLHDIEGLRVEDGLLQGTTGAIPVLRLRVDDELESDDVLAEVRLKLKVSAGTRLGLMVNTRDTFDREKAIKGLQRSNFWLLSADLAPGDELATVSVDLSHAPSTRLSEIRNLMIGPSDAAGATFAIEEVRLVSRKEKLATIPSGFSWQGLAEIYRETLVLRSPETASLEVDLPSRPWLDLAIGTIEPQPATLRVVARTDSGEVPLLRRTLTTPDRWEEVPLELDAFAGRRVELVFSVTSDTPGTLGLFGTPVVRQREALPQTAQPHAAPKGVILVLCDTLRRDHLDMYGYERTTAPNLTRLANEGALFLDNVSQGTWTKVSVPSILSSLYPTSHGLVNARDRLPSSVTTLAEAYHEAGYATFATSSVFFTGKLSNLNQGVDVLHERSSLPDFDHSGSKTARTYVDRLSAWLEQRRDGPFFALLHIFDPHDPFPPYAPYHDLWSADDADEAHDEDVETLKEWQEENDEDEEGMPPERELLAAGVDPEAFTEREINWYDESIRGMDMEIARLLERLEELGLADDVIVAFISDHGEEFLEHGRHFHGDTTYGEMTNVPLFLWGPRWVPAGTVVEETVQSVDLMPTLLQLTGLPVPELAQGQSLVPLLGGDGTWNQRPAISESRFSDFRRERDPDDRESFSIVHAGYRLIHNGERPEGVPEFELYDHVNDPNNQHDLATSEPEKVQKLAAMLATWKRFAESQRIDGAGDQSELTASELEELRALGYLK